MEAIQLGIGAIIFVVYVWTLVRPFKGKSIGLTEGPLTFSRPTQYVGLPNEYSAIIDARVPRV